MPLKDDLEHAGDHAKDAAKHASDAGGKAVKQVADAANEARHHAAAEKEHESREVLGDRLSAGAKVKSVAEESKHRVQESVSGVKRKLDDL